MTIRVQDPTSGQTIELPEASFDPQASGVGTTQRAAAYDKDGDKVLTLADRPDGITDEAWRAYLSGLAAWAKLYPAAVTAVQQVRASEAPVLKMGADIRARLDEAAKNDRLSTIRAALAGDGIGITATGTTDRTDGKIHTLTREGRPDTSIAFWDDAQPEQVLMRARLAMGVLPDAAATFAKSLPQAQVDQLTKLFATGIIRPEESEVRYRARDALFTKINTMKLENDVLTVAFGDERGDGPGVLRLKKGADSLEAAAVFEYFSSRETKLEL